MGVNSWRDRGRTRSGGCHNPEGELVGVIRSLSAAVVAEGEREGVGLREEGVTVDEASVELVEVEGVASKESDIGSG